MGVYADGKEIIKDITNIAKSLSERELNQKILELQSTFYELNDENRELREQLHELKNNNLINSKMKYRNGVYLKEGQVFCSVCWDRDNKLVRVRQTQNPDQQGNKVFQCDACKDWRFSDISYEDK